MKRFVVVPGTFAGVDLGCSGQDIRALSKDDGKGCACRGPRAAQRRGSSSHRTDPSYGGGVGRTEKASERGKQTEAHLPRSGRGPPPAGATQAPARASTTEPSGEEGGARGGRLVARQELGGKERRTKTTEQSRDDMLRAGVAQRTQAGPLFWGPD